MNKPVLYDADGAELIDASTLPEWIWNFRPGMKVHLFRCVFECCKTDGEYLLLQYKGPTKKASKGNEKC